MDLRSDEFCDHVVVALRGELDLADAAVAEAALEAATALAPGIIVDLSDLEFIDARGVKALLRGRKAARAAGGDLVLAAPRPQVRPILSILWEVGGAGLYPGVAAAASARACGQGAVPIRRLSARPRRQRTAATPPAQRWPAVTAPASRAALARRSPWPPPAGGIAG